MAFTSNDFQRLQRRVDELESLLARVLPQIDANLKSEVARVYVDMEAQRLALQEEQKLRARQIAADIPGMVQAAFERFKTEVKTYVKMLMR